MMVRTYEAIRSVAFIFILLALICALTLAMENKTAYTRDGIHFISKERMEENIKYEYAKAGEYQEVQVPFDTLIVGASIIPQLAEEKESEADKKEGDGREADEEQADKKAAEVGGGAPQSIEGGDSKYPYAALGIGLLLATGLVASAARMRGRRRRRGRRSLRRR